jgi:hypothetical protein
MTQVGGRRRRSVMHAAHRRTPAGHRSCGYRCSGHGKAGREDITLNEQPMEVKTPSPAAVEPTVTPILISLLGGGTLGLTAWLVEALEDALP